MFILTIYYYHLTIFLSVSYAIAYGLVLKAFNIVW